MSTEVEKLAVELRFQQEKLSETHDGALKRLAALNREANLRWSLAFVFRGIVVLGGFSIGFGLPGEWPRFVGGLLTCVGLIDNQWLFNHESLMFVVPARNAYRRLVNDVAQNFTDAFKPVAGATSESDLKSLVANVVAARRTLYEIGKRIDTALENRELGVLRKLAVQQDPAPIEAPTEQKLLSDPPPIGAAQQASED